MTPVLSFDAMRKLDRPASSHHMERSHRAKQFAPFAALKGFEDAVREKEVLYIGKPQLSEEETATIDRLLRRLTPGQRIRVSWFQEFPLAPPGKGQRLTVSAAFLAVDEVAGLLLLEGRRLPLTHILSLHPAES